ncbi:MAG: hypothetical protein RSB64_19175, partial [Pseudomonas sp.]
AQHALGIEQPPALRGLLGGQDAPAQRQRQAGLAVEAAGAQVDAVNNRTKRKFADRTGIRCGSHQQLVLLQTYTRDTGELMHDLSVPITIKGRHWGGLRLGYKPESPR